MLPFSTVLETCKTQRLDVVPKPTINVPDLAALAAFSPRSSHDMVALIVVQYLSVVFRT